MPFSLINEAGGGEYGEGASGREGTLSSSNSIGGWWPRWFPSFLGAADVVALVVDDDFNEGGNRSDGVPTGDGSPSSSLLTTLGIVYDAIVVGGKSVFV